MGIQRSGTGVLHKRKFPSALWISLSGAAISEAGFALATERWSSRPLPYLVLWELRITLLAFCLGCAVLFALRYRYGGRRSIACACIAFLPLAVASIAFISGPSVDWFGTFVRLTEIYAAVALLGIDLMRLMPRWKAYSWTSSLPFGTALLGLGLFPRLMPDGIPWLFVPALVLGQIAYFAVRRFADGRSPGEVSIRDDALDHYRISEREREVARMVATGSTNQEIADALFISLSTVKAHISSIFEKTGTKNRVAMLAALSRTIFG